MSLLKQLFGSWSKTTDDIDESNQNERMSIYIFHPEKIGESVSTMYGAYAHSQFLGALHTVIQPLGGWKILPGLMCCHGDFSNKDVFEKPMGTKVLSDWVRLNSSMNVIHTGDFFEKIKTDPTKVGYIPYAIGCWPITESFSNSVHNALLSSGAIGYVGSVSLDPDPGFPFLETRLAAMQEAGLSGPDAVFSAIASTLCLSVNIGIRSNGQCFGWLVSATEITKVGLSILEQTSNETQLGQKISEAKSAVRNGDIKLALSLMKEAAELAPNEEERNQYLEQAEKLGKLP